MAKSAHPQYNPQPRATPAASEITLRSATPLLPRSSCAATSHRVGGAGLPDTAYARAEQVEQAAWAASDRATTGAKVGPCVADYGADPSPLVAAAPAAAAMMGTAPDARAAAAAPSRCGTSEAESCAGRGIAHSRR